MKQLILPRDRIAALNAGFMSAFGYTPSRYFSAPGRTELSGNHTDHQCGRVLAAAVNLDMQAAVCLNNSSTIRILSQGYPMCVVDLTDLRIKKEEINSTAALVRGVVARFTEYGCKVGGFDAYMESTVLPGSGLSSSAAFEVLIGTIVNHLFFDNELSQSEIAMIGQFAENVYFGKPCGLMDQMASALGGMVTIDFADNLLPAVEPVDFDFASCGHALCIIDSLASHADLTDEYAAITQDMKAVAGFFGCQVLRQVCKADFEPAIPQLRKQFGDRSVLRAMHFLAENDRVVKQVEALRQGNFDEYLRLMKQSGFSSYMYLQNVIPAGYKEHQDMAIVLSMCAEILGERGGYRVHGGGFAGTVQAFVPMDLLDEFRSRMDAVLGKGACHVLSIRTEGGVEAIGE